MHESRLDDQHESSMTPTSLPDVGSDGTPSEWQRGMSENDTETTAD
ncbi:hypothetical protein Pcac1_g9503 [Phytophthora cactorum]|nr:hypothetical protein Pcac1_g9503 [Phytophthora cactorum]